MANENKEIGDIVKKCKILLLDVAGTTTSISFVKKDLVSYAEENVQKFLDSQWESDAVKEVVAGLRKLALEDKEGSVEGAVEIPAGDAPKEEQIAGLVKSVKWQISWDRQAGPLKELQGLIWKQGYDSGDLKGHVFDDVSPALKQWRSVDGQKVYVFSSGSVLSQKLLFGKSTAGDLQPLIDGYFDTAVGSKQEAASYTNIAKDIGCKAEEILYINDTLKEAEGARSAGLQAALVARDGNEPLPAGAAFPLIRSLAELAELANNKRKPEPVAQHEEQPAKILKTVTEESVNRPVENKTPSTETMEVETSDVPEKMDVEEPVTAGAPQAAAKEEIEVEELTDSNDVPVEPVTDIEPVVIDEEEKAKDEEKQTEKKDKETKETADAKVATPVAEETPPAVITEIEEVSDKQLGDVADIVEDLEPIVEEPTAAEDVETLQNVGDVLEKECDEILSKVHNVTNLENITIKPMLNPIAEEAMETDNTNSNDIVDRILDTELEMEQCADIDLNTVSEITDDTKSEVVKENCTKDQVPPAEATENKVTMNSVENTEKKVSEETKASVEATENKITENSVEKTEEIVSVETKTQEKTQSKVDSKVPDEADVTKETTEPKENPAAATDAPSAEKDEVKPAVESTQNGDSVANDVKETTEEVKIKPDAKELQVNGKTNGNGDVTLNGDSKDELNARLKVENDNAVNGANGDSAEAGQGDAPTVDVKAKCAAEDKRAPAGPQDQPTEA